MQVSGVTEPDITGQWTRNGSYLDFPRYTHPMGWWSIWNNVPAEQWWISETAGDVGLYGWKLVSPEIEGLYEPYGTATGDATVTRVV